MRFALVLVEAPKGNSHEEDRAWLSMRSIVEDKTKQSGKVTTLHDGCYVCDLGSGLRDLQQIVRIASDHRLQSRTLFFEKEPPFVITPAS